MQRLPSLVPAALSVAAAAASFISMYLISRLFGAGPGAAILSAVLALSFARRRAAGESRPWGWELGGILVVGVGAMAVSWLLHAYFPVGAAVFTAALFLSVWLRRFGGRLRELGRVVALPFIALLVAPGAPHSPAGPGADLLLVLLAGVIAFAFDRLLLQLEPVAATTDRESTPRKAEKGALSTSTRMAVQMSVALAAAFLAGGLIFPGHWSWVVITAFIVCSGAIGRGDAAYKGVLRLGGAFLGVVAASALQYVAMPHGPMAAALSFAALFVGVWLRDVSYAWWAACVTLILALMLPTNDVPVTVLLAERLAAIFVGAICGVAACWFVFPIKSRSVVRRRVSDTLLALEEWAGAPESERQQKLSTVKICAEECERIAAPLRWQKRLTGITEDAEHPAVWLSLVQRCAEDAASIQPSTELVKAVRLSRRALKEEQGLTPTLLRVQVLLEG
jgi:hypothetical protein